MKTPYEIAIEYIESEEVKEKVKHLPNDINELDYKNQLFKSKFFTAITSRPTPLEFIKTRKGAYDKETQKKTVLEYFSEEYTMYELDNIFSGWWTEDMDYQESTQYPTGRVSGYLCAEYTTLKGTEVVKRYAVASAKQDTKADGGFMNVDDLEKKALTEWFKIAGKRFGFGFDLYHQRITKEHWDMFYNMTRLWLDKYGKDILETARLFETGMKFREFMRDLPTYEQTKKLDDMLKRLPNDTDKIKQFKDDMWNLIIKHSNINHKETLKTENQLVKINEIVNKLLTQEGETTNE